MRLTLTLLRRNRLPNGNIFRGKDRLVKKVEPVHLHRITQEFEMEEQNMFYLRFPYLTQEQSTGHAKAYGVHEKRRQLLVDKSARIFKEDVTIAERLMHMRVNEGWDK